MTTPTGKISLSDVNIELGNASNLPISLNFQSVRTLAGAGGPGTLISMQMLRGKSNSIIADILLVGGGGGGTAGSWGGGNGNGGSGGAFVALTGITISAGVNNPVYVGAGGSPSGAGWASRFLSYSAAGGSPGQNGGAGPAGQAWVNGATYGAGGGAGKFWRAQRRKPPIQRGPFPGGAGGGGAGGDGGDGGGGSANTGSGGGGGRSSGGASSSGGPGGSGIVIIRYLGSQKASGGSVSSSGGYTYHTFTQDGTFRV